MKNIFFFAIINFILLAIIIPVEAQTINELYLNNKREVLIEIYNIRNYLIKVRSLNYSDEIMNNFITKHFEIKPGEFYIDTIKIPMDQKNLYNFHLKYYTIDKTASFESKISGYFLVNENFSRIPNFTGDFFNIGNNNTFLRKNDSNLKSIMKLSSKTKFSPRDSSPNAALYFDGFFWIFGGWDYDIGNNNFSSKSNIWKSKDCIDWQLVNDTPPFSHYNAFIVFANKMLVFSNLGFYSSTDGIYWDFNQYPSHLSFFNQQYGD